MFRTCINRSKFCSLGSADRPPVAVGFPLCPGYASLDPRRARVFAGLTSRLACSPDGAKYEPNRRWVGTLSGRFRGFLVEIIGLGFLSLHVAARAQNRTVKMLFHQPLSGYLRLPLSTCA